MSVAVIYCRLSKHLGDSRSASTLRQESETREMLAAEGYEVEQVFADEDVSAYSGRRRPAFQAMCDRVEEGGVDAIGAWHPDRLYRRLTELESFTDLVIAAGVVVLTVQTGRVDLSTTGGRMFAAQLATAARYESDHRSDRTKLAHRKLALDGRWKGGRRPYGYKSGAARGELLTVESEAVIVREIADRVLAGERAGAIVRDLNARNVASARGGAWRVATLVGMMKSPTIAGRRVHLGEDVGQAAWEPILDSDVAAAVRARLDDPLRARGPVPRVALLAGGRCRCGRCGGPLRTASRAASTGGRRIYRCPPGEGCGRLSVSAEALEAVVVEAVHVALEGADLRSPEPDNEAAAGLAEERRLLDRISQIAEERAKDQITFEEWEVMRRSLNERLDALRATRRPTPVRSKGARSSRSQWEHLDLPARQALFDAVLREVVVLPATSRGPTFQLDRVEFGWRA